MKLIKIIVFAILIAMSSMLYSTLDEGLGIYESAIEKMSLENKVHEIRNSKHFISIDEVSENFIEAVIAAEDKRFYTHNGIDFYAISRATFDNVKYKRIVAGGSTITQQLSKNMYFSFEKKIERKIAELFLSKDLERNYTKKEILELYVNIIYYGDGYTGIKQASEGYFGIKPLNLTRSQAIILAGLPQAPSRYALSTNFDNAVNRGSRVIDLLVRNNKIKILEGIKLKEELKNILIINNIVWISKVLS